MIFYFSATGNSQFVAESLGQALGERIVDIGKLDDAPISNIDTKESLGFVFPVYGWGIPKIVQEFIHSLSKRSNARLLQNKYVWATVTCGDDVGMADKHVRRALAVAGLHLDAIFSVIMPNTYVCLPGFDVDKAEIRHHKLARCRQRVAAVADAVKNKRNVTDIHRGAFPRFKTYVLGYLFRRFLITDKPFHATSSCTHCGLCAHVCPLHNISVSPAALPHWHGRCTGCLSCYHHCPQRAIRFGARTENKGQYVFSRFVGEIN